MREIWCAAILFCSHRLFFSGRRGAAPYGLIRKCGSPPSCFVLIVCFQAGDHWSPLQKQQDLIVVCRGDSRIARNVVLTIFRLRTNERLPSILVGRGLAPAVTLSALSFGSTPNMDQRLYGRFTNRPQRCLLYLSASHKRTDLPRSR